ncbi:MAG: mechanosensitive ion channel family protein [Candidatus Gastranaerophilales bacterium]|nr:mechanosensitive ion channel family protein [Candidatus Gastranaerophilales bacterium]
MNIELTLKTFLNWLLINGLPVILIIIGGFVSIKIFHFVLDRYFKIFAKTNDNIESEKRNNTLKAIMKSVFDIFIIISALLLILNKLGINIAPILAAAGVVGIAVGFGAQRFVEDIINGIIILAEDQIRVGDVVEIAGKGGLVERVDLKMVVLRDLSGNVHYIRNGKIDIVTNMTKDFSRYVFDIGVAYKENIENVIEIIKSVDEDLRNDPNFVNDILEPIEILGLDKFTDSAVIIRARTTTKPIKQWYVARAFNLRLKKRFDELGIEIPFPHRTLYVGQNKDSSSPILNMNVENQLKG